MTTPADTTEPDALAALLPDRWRDLTETGATVDGFTTVATEDYDERRWNMIVRVITCAPSGRHYAWFWERGLTECQESFGPAEHGSPKVTEVHEEQVTVTRWLNGPAKAPENADA